MCNGPPGEHADSVVSAPGTPVFAGASCVVATSAMSAEQRHGLSRELDRCVVLVGLMGAGKSSIGRRLAQRLGLSFVDADQEIEDAAGCSIPDFFQRYGEQAFRDGERRVIARLLHGPPRVLATGGGAFMDAQTRSNVAAMGIAVWLRADLDVLVKRVARRSDRPLLHGGDPREILQGLMDRRYPVYALADITIDSGDSPHEAVVDRIIAALETHLAAQAPAGEAPTTP